MKIEDFLDPLEEEHLKLVFSPKNQRIRGLSTSFFNTKFLLDPTSGKSKVKAIFVKPLTSNSAKIIVGLLWNVLFGRKFKVIHWYLLFLMLLRTIQKDKESLALMSILSIGTANAGLTRWDTNLKPIRSTLLRIYGEHEGLKMLNGIIEHLPFQLPKKEPKIDDLLSYQFKDYFQKKPKELVRIGVGYKDQGSLGKSGIEPLSSDFKEKEVIFEVLLRQVQQKFSLLLNEEKNIKTRGVETPLRRSSL